MRKRLKYTADYRQPSLGGWVNEKAGSDRDERKSSDDLWVSTVTNVAAFLGGFSLAAVITVTDGADHFRWPGWVILLLTIAAVALIVAAQEVRRTSHNYSISGNENYAKKWHRRIWVPYHVGIIALLGGLGLALAPQHDVGTEEILRWAAMVFALVACAIEFFLSAKTAWRYLRSQDQSSGRG
jgi:cation transport ATPase